MKALSLHAPYAALITTAVKTVEWRSWRTHYRGDLLICAGAYDRKEWYALPKRHAIAVVNLDDCVPMTDKYLYDAYMSDLPEPAGWAWLLNNIRPIEPVFVRGQQGLFNVDIKPVYLDISPQEDEALLQYWADRGLTKYP